MLWSSQAKPPVDWHGCWTSRKVESTSRIGGQELESLSGLGSGLRGQPTALPLDDCCYRLPHWKLASFA